MRKQITAKFESKCYECGEPINPGDKIFWDRDESMGESCAWHIECDRSVKSTKSASQGNFPTGPAKGL